MQGKDGGCSFHWNPAGHVRKTSAAFLLPGERCLCYSERLFVPPNGDSTVACKRARQYLTFCRMRGYAGQGNAGWVMI